MDNIKMTVTGLAELEKKMHELGPKLGRQALRAAINAGAQIIKKEAQARAPELTGKLKKNIFVKRATESCTPTKEFYVVGVRKGYYVVRVSQGHKKLEKVRDAFYWRFLEFGTMFIAARPFLAPAFETKKMEAFEAIKQKLGEKLQSLAQEKTLTRRVFQ